MAPSITFHGAARTVTGSKHLIETNGKKILVDCGLFQGSSELGQRNWFPFPFEPRDLDAVVITHAHMDHIGMLPKLARDGYQGPIYATPATIALAKISLPDGGRIQEEDARYANRKRTSQHSPALPLYTERDAYTVLKQFEKVHYYDFNPLPGGGTFRFMPAGHILGSAFAEIYFDNGERIMMSGDLGRYGQEVIKDPTPVDYAEYLTIESTYGDRLHEREDTLSKIEAIFGEAYRNGSVVLVPSFAIGRTQELLYSIHRLQDQGRLPRIPIFLDSPMAVSTTDIYAKAKEEFDDDMKAELELGHQPLEPENLTFVRDREQSKQLNSMSGPMVIIAGSGMANGGRIVHHLLQRLRDPTTVVLFTGYQAEGTLGRRLLEGEPTVRIHGNEVDVRASVYKLNALSAHCDQGEMMYWLKQFKAAPKQTFIVHGEPGPQEVLAAKIRDELGWPVSIPEPHQTFELA